MFRTFEHTVDLGLVVEAPDRESLFAEAGRALLSLLVENPDAVRPQREVTLDVEGTELDYLLFDWLNELLYRFDRDRLLLSEFDIAFTGSGLSATAHGEPLDRERHQLAHEIKASASSQT